MRNITLGVLVSLTPAILGAQASGTTNAQAQSNASARTDARAEAQASTSTSMQISIPQDYSAEGKARLEALYADARARGTSEVAIARRVAEGQAKGATEAQVIAAASAQQGQMVVAKQAMLQAGRAQPTPDEVERGANAMARGVSSVQLESIVRRAPNERSLVVAFEVLTDLAARGVPVGQAVTQIQGQIDARATDAALRELGASVTGAGNAEAGRGGASVNGTVNGLIRRGGGR